MKPLIALLIPTMNRTDFLVRLLHYYYQLRFDGCLYIGDSSNAEHLARTKAAIERYRDRLNIVHEEYPGLNNAQTIHLMLASVSAPYAAFIADDDFLVPDALAKCAGFLERNAGYVAAHGVGIAVRLATSGPFGEPEAVHFYGQAEVEGETSAERLRNYAVHPLGVQFSLHRTDAWRTMYRDVTTIEDIAFGTEILPCFLSAALGKIKSLDGLYLVRQLHDQQYIYRSEPLEWLTSRAWFPSYEAFYSSVAREIARQDGISTDAAAALVRQLYRANIKTRLFAHYRKTEPAFVDTLRREAQRLRIAPALRRMKQAWRGGSGAYSLPAMLSPSSPYCSDFTHLYKAFTVRPHTLNVAAEAAA